ncbi:MAG: molybdopterin dinucleotide binding domain-containing protein, partial [Tepidiforma sp.]
GLGKFVPVRQAALAAELPDSEYPLVLNTGRVLYHWHGGTITRRVQALVEQMPEVPVAIHPDDAAWLGIDDGSEVVVRSRRGRLSGKAVVTDAVRQGSIFVPFVKLQESAANFLTNNAYDEPSRIPEYKVCAVRVEKKRPRTAAATAAPPTASRGR